jgi:hypothetical protein
MKLQLTREGPTLQGSISTETLACMHMHELPRSPQRPLTYAKAKEHHGKHNGDRAEAHCIHERLHMRKKQQGKMPCIGLA